MTGFTCTTCGQYHDELPMCFGPLAPAAYFAVPEDERESRCILSSDQCIIDEKHFFILGRIILPVVDGEAPFIRLLKKGHEKSIS